MNIEIFHLIEGAKQAEGLTVIIDVFRAFSMECYLYASGAREVRPMGTVEETFAWRDKDSTWEIPRPPSIRERSGGNG